MGIGFTLVKQADADARTVALSEATVAHRTAFAPEAITETITLQKADAPFCLIPSTFDAGVEAAFSLEIFASLPVQLQERPAASSQITKCKGAWAKGADGGCTNNETWKE